jgi:hypothetical protein
LELESGQWLVKTLTVPSRFTSKCTKQCSTGLFRWKNFSIEAKTSSITSQEAISPYLKGAYDLLVFERRLRGAVYGLLNRARPSGSAGLIGPNH